jgi:uncharacterized glyoxalase superfamily protein PhnB
MSSHAPVNRSMPPGTFIPVVGYADPIAAARWLVAVFGFRERLIIGSHRVQLTFGGGAVVAAEGAGGHRVMVRVEDVDRHHQRALEAGAQIVEPPRDYPYGERQYSVLDPGGNSWTFSQSIADVDPASWGGVLE